MPGCPAWPGAGDRRHHRFPSDEEPRALTRWSRGDGVAGPRPAGGYRAAMRGWGTTAGGCRAGGLARPSGRSSIDGGGRGDRQDAGHDAGHEVATTRAMAPHMGRRTLVDAVDGEGHRPVADGRLPDPASVRPRTPPGGILAAVHRPRFLDRLRDLDLRPRAAATLSNLGWLSCPG